MQPLAPVPSPTTPWALGVAIPPRETNGPMALPVVVNNLKGSGGRQNRNSRKFRDNVPADEMTLADRRLLFSETRRTATVVRLLFPQYGNRRRSLAYCSPRAATIANNIHCHLFSRNESFIVLEAHEVDERSEYKAWRRRSIASVGDS